MESTTTFRGGGRPRHEPSRTAATHIPPDHVRATAAMIAASEALERLREGNHRVDVRGRAAIVTQTLISTLDDTRAEKRPKLALLPSVASRQ